MITLPWVLDFGRVPYVYDYCTRLDLEGITSWYQSRLPVGHPLPTPWSKSSLVFANYFANSVVWLIVSRRKNWMVLGSFSPHLYSRNLISLLFQVKDFANSNSRFSWLLPPGEPLISDDSLIDLKIPMILSDKFSGPYVPLAFSIPYHRKIPMDFVNTRNSSCSCCYKIPWNILRCFENPLQPTALEVLLPCLPYG